MLGFCWSIPFSGQMIAIPDSIPAECWLKIPWIYHRVITHFQYGGIVWIFFHHLQMELTNSLSLSGQCPINVGQPCCLVVYLPLWKIWVSWDYYSQYTKKWRMFQTTNQPVYCGLANGLWQGTYITTIFPPLLFLSILSEVWLLKFLWSV